MTVVDVNTGKFVGSGGNLEQTVTRNNMEAAEEIVRQLRLRDIGGIIVIDFIDMVLESNRDLVLRRLTECLGRDRTKHQVAEVTSLGLVQMTRKRVGQGLLEVFSEPCEHCRGRGVIVSHRPGRREAPQRRRRAADPAARAAPAAARRRTAGGDRPRRLRRRQGRPAAGVDTPAEEAAAPPRPTATDGEPAEGTRTGGRRNRGRRGRGQSGEDRAAEDAAVLAGAQTDVEPDAEDAADVDAAARGDRGRRRRAVAGRRHAVEVVPALPEPLPTPDGEPVPRSREPRAVAVEERPRLPRPSRDVAGRPAGRRARPSERPPPLRRCLPLRESAGPWSGSTEPVASRT